jgi:hypothetical protein
MRQESSGSLYDARVRQAVAELTACIKHAYPSTSVAVQRGMDDPQETWLVATVDIEDPDEVIDLVLPRLLELQVDQGLPIHVLPIHTPERVARTLERQTN